MTVQASPGSTAKSAEDRTFIWITPERRKPTEYELYTVGLQSDPEHWLDVGWPVHFDDGRPPWSDSSSAAKSVRWASYRDPGKRWQRPYVATANQDGQALSRMLPVLVRGCVTTLDPTWAERLLGRVYAAWPFAEHGLFRALAYAVREARSDTLEFDTVFHAVDRMRLLQDIVLHIDLVQHELPGFTDDGARDAWMEDPVLTPVRQVVEQLVACTDWVEIVVATALVFEPTVGRLAKVELFSGLAPSYGDGMTPAVMARSVADNERASRSAQALVELLRTDPEHGAANDALLRSWVATWLPRCEAAMTALTGAFGEVGVEKQVADAAVQRVLAFHQAVLAECGLAS